MSNLNYFAFAAGLSKLAAAQIDVSDLAFEEERERRHEQNIRTIEQFDPADEAETSDEESEYEQ